MKDVNDKYYDKVLEDLKLKAEVVRECRKCGKALKVNRFFHPACLEEIKRSDEEANVDDEYL